MNSTQMPKLFINGFTIDRPIIQGGMGVGISMSGLASAVANENGIGVISSVGLGLLEAKSLQTYREENKTILAPGNSQGAYPEQRSVGIKYYGGSCRL